MKNFSGDLYIQTHDFPDPDAVASAYGIHQLLKAVGYEASIVYSGFIQRRALNRLISEMNIEIKHHSTCLIQPDDGIIIVDGHSSNRNVLPLAGQTIAIIDHHPMVYHSNEVSFITDIRDHFGACSSMVGQYFQRMTIKPSQNCATALCIGIARDTDSFKRMISTEDLEIFHYLWPFVNEEKYYSIIRNNIETQDQLYYRKLMNTMETYRTLAFVYFPNGCPTGMMGILGDFLLSMDDVDFSIIGAKNGRELNISIRSEVIQWNAAKILSSALQDRGIGGGHHEMAGGILKNGSSREFLELIEVVKTKLWPRE